jgi:hypothetical protein
MSIDTRLANLPASPAMLRARNKDRLMRCLSSAARALAAALSVLVVAVAVVVLGIT